MESILLGGVDANHKDAHGNTALHLSCANGHAEVVRALIKGGASHLPNGAGNRYIRTIVSCSPLLLLKHIRLVRVSAIQQYGAVNSATAFLHSSLVHSAGGVAWHGWNPR